MAKLLNSFLKISGFYILVGAIVRIILLFLPITNNSFPEISDYFKIFLLGIVNDLCVSIIFFVFFWLYLIFLSDRKFKSPWGSIILIIMLCLLGYLMFFHTIFDDYGKLVSKLLIAFLIIKVISFALLLFFPVIRKSWRYSMYCIIFFLYVYFIIFIAVSEFLFWNEFGVRYNFIAVDYLIYTNEVIGNILESYPVIPMFSVLVLISIIITIFYVKKSKKYFNEFSGFKTKLISSLIYLGLIIGSIYLLKYNQEQENSENEFVNELQSNGLFRFYNAFMDSSLNYDKFYAKIPEKKAIQIIEHEYGMFKNGEIIKDTLPEIKKNVVLVTIESMSSSFLNHFGNKKNLTPNLDKLAEDGIFFSNLYATGNRTVRGLEALTLCIPPSPGESLVKRKNTNNLFSTGYLFNKKGYTVQFFYGGYSYFDNMKTFFKGNGYQVIDRNSLTPNEITFANIWGVCDEDIFNKAIKVFDENNKKRKPFFGHIMTVSNHRPFTYPEGKIGNPENEKTREGGVKYTDYAIGRFINEARKHSWFSNTVFIFVADHCASSAGKEDIPLEGYRIPAIIYSPGFIQPEKITKLVSQIDLMPTVLGKLHFSYTSFFYGQDIFSSKYIPRAPIATYQKLGYLKKDIVIVLSPKQKIEQYSFNQNKLEKNKHIDKNILEEAIANYQTISHLIENNSLKIKK